jgi:hypothetical protein
MGFISQLMEEHHLVGLKTRFSPFKGTQDGFSSGQISSVLAALTRLVESSEFNAVKANGISLPNYPLVKLT